MPDLEPLSKLAPKLELLIRCPPLLYGELPPGMPLSGVYLFSEAGRDLSTLADPTACGRVMVAIVVLGRPTGKPHSHSNSREKPPAGRRPRTRQVPRAGQG
jgi:hypothetical protein